MKMHFARSLKMVAVAAAVGLTSASFAVTMVSTNLAQMVELAEKAFVGTVTSVRVVKTAHGWADEVRVRVSEPVLGAVSAGDTVAWQQYRSDETIRLPGVPQYEEGGEYLVFLAARAAPEGFQAAVGLGQGSFRVHRNLETGRVLVRNEFMNAGLFDGLDVDLVAEAVVAREPAAGSLRPDERQQRSRRLGATLVNRQAGASDLTALVAAAKAMKAEPKPGEAFRRQGDGTSANRGMAGRATVPINP